MKEINNIEKAKQIISNLDIIIYGTIRDIERHFLNSFSNIELLTQYFNSAYIIILENDSKDNTRNLLMEWYQSNHSPNIKKHIFLLDNVDDKFPLRAHRLAYCRNIILEYIFNNNLNDNYQYAFHCDLDDRFWYIDFDSMINCFQYDLNEWDMMSCVNKKYSYYDWWALRCENTWFNKNIFSCETENINYESKIDEFCNFLKKNQLISVNSAFNGFGIYKLSSMKNCYYSAEYYCNKCYNEKRGCKEDNDHIGLHRNMKENSCKLFINTNFNISTLPDHSMTYNDFIINYKNKIPYLNKDPLYYVLINNLISSDGIWLNFGIKDGEIINQISKNTDKNVFSFDEFENSFYKKDDSIIYTFQKFKEEIKPFLNKNIKILPGYLNETISSFKKKYLKNEVISFIYIHSFSYQTTKQIIYSLIDKINNGCIIVFNEFINYKNFFIYEFKVFYEFVQEFKIDFEFVGSYENFKIKSQEMKNSKKSVAIRIIKNPYFNNAFFENNCFIENFDWEFYLQNYEDLKHIKSEEEAKYHWINYGSKEGRICKNKKLQKKKDLFDKKDFDWIHYISKYDDLKYIQIEEDAWHHWINYGSKEGRNYKKKTKPEKNRERIERERIERERIERERVERERVERERVERERAERERAERERIEIERIERERVEKEKEKYKNIVYSFTLKDFENFDWDYYVHKYSDLTNIQTKEEAWNHWVNFGSKEGRSCDYFDWFLYLQLNPDLGQSGISTKEGAIYHWNNHGKKEGRKYM